MWRLYAYLWTSVLLLLPVALAAQKGFYIDRTCPPNVRGAIHEAIFDLLPTAYAFRSDKHLELIMSFFYPLLPITYKKRLWRMLTKSLLSIVIVSLLTSVLMKVISGPSEDMTLRLERP